MLEDLKPTLNDLGEKLDQMRISLEIPAKEEKIAELEYKMSEPTFWDDAAAAQKVNQELAGLKGGVDTYKAHGGAGLDADAPAHVRALGGAARIYRRDRRPPAGRRGGRQVREPFHQGAQCLRLFEIRKRRPSSRPHLPV